MKWAITKVFLRGEKHTATYNSSHLNEEKKYLSISCSCHVFFCFIFSGKKIFLYFCFWTTHPHIKGTSFHIFCHGYQSRFDLSYRNGIYIIVLAQFLDEFLCRWWWWCSPGTCLTSHSDDDWKESNEAASTHRIPLPEMTIVCVEKLSSLPFPPFVPQSFFFLFFYTVYRCTQWKP